MIATTQATVVGPACSLNEFGKFIFAISQARAGSCLRDVQQLRLKLGLTGAAEVAIAAADAIVRLAAAVAGT